jgi:hypothetical protein
VSISITEDFHHGLLAGRFVAQQRRASAAVDRRYDVTAPDRLRQTFALFIAATALVLVSADITQAQRRTVVRHHRHGHVIKTLPPGHTGVAVRGVSYRTVGGAFYQPHARGWVVVAPPVGGELRHLPAGATVVRVNGVRYHRYAGAHYRPVIKRGRTIYVVARL